MEERKNIEKAIIGAIILNHSCLVNVDFLKSDDFSIIMHQEVFDHALQALDANEGFDLVICSDKLKSKYKAYELAALTSGVSSVSNIEYHARILQQYSIKSKLSDLSVSINSNLQKDFDALELLEQTENDVFNIQMVINRSKPDVSMADLKNDFIVELDNELVEGLKTGFKEYDELTGGLQNGNLYIVAGRPGSGKSTLSMNYAENIALQGYAVAVASLEMPSKQLFARMVSSNSGVFHDNIKKKDMQDRWKEKAIHSAETLSNLDIFIVDKPGVSIQELKSKCKQMKSKDMIDLLVVDYLQLMTLLGGDSKSTNDYVGAISKGLKELALLLNIPVVALSQLSRAVETRGGDKRPILSDLRDSGSIEQDADEVMFMYRPEYYGIMEDEEGRSTKGYAEAIIAKNRHGKTGTIPLTFRGEIFKFSDYQELEF